MPETCEMLKELFEMVLHEEIYDDSCDHETPASPEKWCRVCFLTNMWFHTSESDPHFTDETSQEQRDTVERLWDQHCGL